MIDLPSLNRRRLLMGLAAASTAAAVPVAVMGATSTARVIPENPELVRLSDMLAGVEAGFYAALDVERVAVRDWSHRWPSAPDAICTGYSVNWSTDCEKGLTGAAVLVNGQHPPTRTDGAPSLWEINRSQNAFDAAGQWYPRTVAKAADWQARQNGVLRALRRKRPRHPLAALDIVAMEIEAAGYGDKTALAAEYEAECARVLKASGYREAVAAHAKAYEAFADHVSATMAMPAETMAGVVIKAEALAAWNRQPELSARVLNMKTWDWPGSLAADIIRLATQHAA